MIDVKKLKGIIVEKGYSQKDVAKSLGIAQKTFYSKMNKGVFGSDEIEKMIYMLEINDPIPIFFAKEVTR